MNADGTNVSRLTKHPAFDWEPAWSPDGELIAFTSDRDGSSQIFIMSVDGPNLKRLTNDSRDSFSAGWSPDGKRIAYVSSCDSGWEIATMSVDGDVMRLTKSQAINKRPSWMSDGRRIVFEREGNIYSMNADGSDITNLTKHSTKEISSVCFCSAR